MKNYLKFLARLPKNLKLKLFEVIELIESNQLDKLDVKPLQAQKGYYRCRVGTIRIIFAITEHGNIIDEMGFRGDVYK